MTNHLSFDDWVGALFERHLADLEFAEVRRALTALSSLYVERRERMQRKDAFAGAGKRAAFALYYGPVHFLAVREIVGALDGGRDPPRQLVDLGCGSGAAGAAWATLGAPRPKLIGVERAAWAAQEARWCYRTFGLAARVARADLLEQSLPGRSGAVLLAYTANELSAPDRERLLPTLLRAAERGARVLVVEPIARRMAPWWSDWAEAFGAAGGRNDEWRVAAVLPSRLRLMARGAGLKPGRLSARSLWLPGGP